MADMRDFNRSDEIRPIISEEIRPADNFAADETLGDFHVVETDAEGSNTGRIVGALAVALLLGTAGIFAYESSKTSSAPANQVAAVTPPVQPAAAPPAQTADTSAPAPSSPTPDSSAQPASQPMTPATTTAPVKSRSVSRTAKADTNNSTSSSSEADMVAPTPTPAVPIPQQSAAAPVPTPNLAANLDNNVQPEQTAPQQPDVTPAQPVQPATTQPDQPATPDQAAPPALPAP